MPLLEVKDLCHSYGGFHLKDINITLNKKQIIYLIGNSGCGKSTILKLIIGLERPTSGLIKIDNQTVFSTRVFIPPEKRGLGIIFQHPSLFPHKSVIENVMFAICGMGKKEQYNIAMEKLEEVGMKSYADHLPYTISGGQQQLVTIARALAQQPKIILLDEPFSNLDVTLRKKIREQMLEILSKHDIASIIVTHDPEEAMESADNIYVIREGKIIQEGSPYNVYYNPKDIRFAKFFGVINKIKFEYKNGKFISIWGDIRTVLSSEFMPYVRPEAILLANKREGIQAKVISIRFFNRIVDIEIGDERYQMRFTNVLLPKKDDIIYVTLDNSQVLFLAN